MRKNGPANLKLNPNISTKAKWQPSKRPLCDCGRPATRLHLREYVCERCYQLEKAGFTGGPQCMTCGVSPMPLFHRLRGKPPGELVSLQEVDGRFVAETSRGTFMRQGQRWQKVRPNGKAAHE